MVSDEGDFNHWVVLSMNKQPIPQETNDYAPVGNIRIPAPPITHFLQQFPIVQTKKYICEILNGREG